jgi:hypothetical protein
MQCLTRVPGRIDNGADNPEKCGYFPRWNSGQMKGTAQEAGADGFLRETIFTPSNEKIL